MFSLLHLLFLYFGCKLDGRVRLLLAEYLFQLVLNYLFFLLLLSLLVLLYKAEVLLLVLWIAIIGLSVVLDQNGINHLEAGLAFAFLVTIEHYHLLVELIYNIRQQYYGWTIFRFRLMVCNWWIKWFYCLIFLCH